MSPSPFAIENPGYLHRLPLAPETNGAANGATWLHMCTRHPETAGQLVGVEGLDRLTVEAMMRQEARSRILVRDDGVMVLLKAMHKREGFKPEDMISLRIWVDRERVITPREADVDAIVDLRDRLLQGQGPTTPAQFLADLVDAHLAEVTEEVDALEDAVGRLDAHTLADRQRGDAVCGDVASMSLTIAGLLRHLTPQRVVLERLSQLNCAFAGKTHVAQWAHALDELLRLLEALQGIREELAIVTAQAQRIQDRQLAKVNLLLGMVAGAFLPTTLFAGLMGMNVGGIPLADQPWAFTVFALACAAFSASILIWFRRRDGTRP